MATISILVFFLLFFQISVLFCSVLLRKMNGFSGNCFGFRRGMKWSAMKPFWKLGAGFILLSVVAIFIFEVPDALNSITRFTSSSFFGSGEESCLSRIQSASYQKPSPHKPSPYLLAKLRSYEELHERCGPHTNTYKRSIKQLKSGRIDTSIYCKYVVWVAKNGLGNRMLSVTSAFLYALLTNRVLLINQERDMAGLFCEPFPNTSWILPDDFPLKSRFWKFNLKQSFDHSYGNLLKRNAINYTTEVLHLYLTNVFFCDQDQKLLAKVPWLITKSDLYFLPSLFLIPSFEQELDELFPDKETVFHHLGRYLFLPSDRVWRQITQYYHRYLAKAEQRIGIQIRIFDDKTSPYELVMDQILSCTQKEKLLPEVDSRGKTSMAASSSPWKNQTSKAVLITSLVPGYSDKLKTMYGDGEAISVYQPSHEMKQRSDSNSHNIQAWVEIYLLSLCDELVTSAWSTFGYVAQGLRGMRPLILYKTEVKNKADPPCGRGVSMEPCYHSPPMYDCKAKAKTTVDTATLVPHIRHCEDIIYWGIKLFNTT